MKVIRHIAFLLSLMVIMGHDIVPHIDEVDISMSEHSAPLTASSNNGLTNLGDIFSHFEHGATERNLIYLTSVEKKADFQIKTFYHIPYLDIIEYRLVWYSNYKKQRFWQDVKIPSSCNISSLSFRGPPSC